MYKRVLSMVLVLLCLTNLCGLRAQESKTLSYLYLGASGGYSTLLGSVKEMKVSGFLEGGLHFGYELRRNHFLFRIGAEGEYYGSSCNTDLEVGDLAILDTRSGQAMMHFDVQSPLKEMQHFVNAGASIMLGFSGNGERDEIPDGGFYALLGAKVLVMCYESSSAKLTYETSGTYEMFIDDYVDMPNHYYTVRTVSAKPKFGFWGCVFATVDLGWEFNMDDYDKLKVGAFADVGVLNVMKGLSRANCHHGDPDVSELVIDSYYRSDAMESVFVTPFMVGVKVTYSWNLDLSSGTCNCLPRKHPKYRTHRKK